MDVGAWEGRLRANFQEYISDINIRILLLSMNAARCVSGLRDLETKYLSISRDADIFQKETKSPSLKKHRDELKTLTQQMSAAQIYAFNMHDGLRVIANNLTALWMSHESMPMGLSSAAEGFSEALRELDYMRNEMLRRKGEVTKKLSS
jgi:hypothetical protein